MTSDEIAPPDPFANPAGAPSSRAILTPEEIFAHHHRRRRATSAQMESRAEFLIAYAAAQAPVTVRGLYYQAEVAALPGIDKTEGSYNKVQRQVLALRRDGRLPYQHVADLTRWMRKLRTFDSVESALRDTARTYRKALWYDANHKVEIWIEKDALAGVVQPITEEYDVPLMPTRGYSSETFAFEAVEDHVDDPRLYVVYYLGDFDRSGRDAANSLWEKLSRFAEERGVEVEFTQLAIEATDIDFASYNRTEQRVLVFLDNDWALLPTREHKRKSNADKKWPHPFAIELDAIEPNLLRAIVRNAIETHLPRDQLAVLKIAEQSERRLIQEWVSQLPSDLRG